MYLRLKAPHSVILEATPASFFLFPSSFLLSVLPKTATGKIQKYVLRKQQPAIAPQ
jgi:acyl-coenzyme A synthetase/AMP-(fatty) acid ligase